MPAPALWSAEKVRLALVGTVAPAPDDSDPVPQIPLVQIKLDQRAQPRAALNTDLTAEYAEAMKGGAQFPPLTVFHDGKAYWLADGFHRPYAASSIGARDIPCIVKEGSLRDAILHSCQANSVHGLRRSDEDKRRAVKVLLADKEWAGWSDREMARRCAVTHPFVAKVREVNCDLTGNVTSEESRNSANSNDSHRTYRTKHGPVATMRLAVNSDKLQASAPLSIRHNSNRAPDEVACHAAITILARSIGELRATAAEIVVSCPDDETRGDLAEACQLAVNLLAEVIKAIEQKAAA